MFLFIYRVKIWLKIINVESVLNWSNCNEFDMVNIISLFHSFIYINSYIQFSLRYWQKQFLSRERNILIPIWNLRKINSKWHFQKTYANVIRHFVECVRDGWEFGNAKMKIWELIKEQHTASIAPHSRPSSSSTICFDKHRQM